MTQPEALRGNVWNGGDVHAGFGHDDEFRVVDAGRVLDEFDVEVAGRAATDFDDDGCAVGPFDVLDVQDAVDEMEFSGDALAVVAELGEACGGRGARRVRSRDHVLVDVVLFVVGESEGDLTLHEHGRKAVV